MGKEIERKFLVNPDFDTSSTPALVLDISQGYLSLDIERSVRVRVSRWRSWHQQAFITVKGRSVGAARPEYEFELANVDEAQEMIDTLCKFVIRKQRTIIKHAGYEWHVDRFQDDNTGLIIAEIELSTEDEQFELPPWIGAEVTEDARYYNLALAQNPYNKWDDNK